MKKNIKNVKSYQGARPDIARFIGNPKRVLDVGCNIGSLGKFIKEKNSETIVHGWDYNPDAIEQAKTSLDLAQVVDLNDLQSVKEVIFNEKYDLIICADVLEHIIDPWSLFKILSGSISDGGKFVISLPNFAFWETFYHLLTHNFPRNPRGIYDDTHLRFFMKKNLQEFSKEGFDMSILARNFRFVEKPRARLNRTAKPIIGWIPWIREFFTFQYIIESKKL